jgi:hypothetical protein
MVVNAVPWYKHAYSKYGYYYDSDQRFSDEQALQPLNLN